MRTASRAPTLSAPADDFVCARGRLGKRATGRATAMEGDEARCCEGGRRGEVRNDGGSRNVTRERGRQGRRAHLRWRATAATAAGERRIDDGGRPTAADRQRRQIDGGGRCAWWDLGIDGDGRGKRVTRLSR
jgi:hypothetical protein